MAKKKNNTKRNIAIGAGTLLAGGLALKSGGLKKAYNSLGRLGKKRGKYKKVNAGDIIKQKSPKQLEKSELIKQRREKLEWDPDKDYDIISDLQDAKSGVIDSLGKLKKNKRDPEMMDAMLNSPSFNKSTIKKTPQQLGISNKQFLLEKHKQKSQILKAEVDKQRKLGLYSKKIKLLSDFTFG